MPAFPINPLQSTGMLPMPADGPSPVRAASAYASSLMQGADQVGYAIDRANRDQQQKDAEARAFAERQQRDEAVLAVTKASTAEHLQSLQDATDAENNGSLPGFTDRWSKAFDQRQEAGAKAIPQTPIAQAMYAQHMASLKEALNVNFFQKEVGARDLQLSTDAEGNIDTAAKVAYIDPRQGADQIAQQRAAILALALPPQEKQALLAKTTRIAYASASAMAERNPAAFLARVSGAGDADKIKADPILSQLGPQNLEALTGHAQALLKQQDAADQREAEHRLKVAQESVQKLQGFADSGQIPDLEYVAEVKAATVGTPFQEAADSLLKMAQQGVAFGSQTLPAQGAMLRGLEAATAKGTDPEQQVRLQHLRTINGEQVKAYADNPWAAGTRFAKLPYQPEMQVTAPEGGVQLVSQRRPLMGALETVTGGAVSPLQPGESAAWGEALSKLSVPQRADTLAAAGQQLNGPEINALADQLGHKDKATALMLKVNDQTTAGRSLAVRIGYGAQALADKTVKADETAQAGWRAEISNMVRGTLGNTAAENDAIEAAFYIRASFDLPASTAPGFDASTPSNENAVRQVLGQPIERAGVKTILPKGMDESTFNDKLRAFTPEQFQALAPEGKVYMGAREVPLPLLRARIVDYGMRYYGPGLYVPVRGNTIITTDKQGTKPLLLKVQ
jgi:hypothetical protein